MLDRLRSELASAADSGRFLRVLLVFALLALVAALLAIGRIAWALAHAAVWVNYRGDTLSRGDMYVSLGLSVLVALGAMAVVLLAVAVLRTKRK